MNRQPVTSSNLVSVGYNNKTNELEIEFNGGGIYLYSNVPFTTYNSLINAASKGKYFHKYIKDIYSFIKEQ